MAITGSGKYIAVAASSTVIDGTTNLGGLVFGNNQATYARIASRYISRDGEVVETALCIDPYWLNPLYLSFPKLTHLRINNYTGYTGSIRVLATWPDDIGATGFTEKTYNFKCGLLLNNFSDTYLWDEDAPLSPMIG
jgi:hypothetical protein